LLFRLRSKEVDQEAINPSDVLQPRESGIHNHGHSMSDC
jgi:hypothetical protein